MADFRIRNVFILGGFAAFLAGLFVISCDVGLGSSVDTQPPTLVIDYPPVAAVVRGEFSLSGTCEDDKGVSKVTVSIVDGNNKPVGESRAAVIEDGRWTVGINESADGAYELADGKYTFSVIAEDGAGRKSDKLERTLEIDNTAPIFIIKNPGTTKKEAPAGFGSSFKVVGLMSEDHEVSQMIVTVYDKSGAKLDSWTEEAVETAGGTEVTFARFDKTPPSAGSDSYELYSRYTKIYDVASGGDQFYSCTVEVMDSAKEYKTPKDGKPSSEDGNKAAAHFLYDDVYEKYMSKLSENMLTVGDIKKILNGTFGTASADEEEASRAATVIGKDTADSIAEELKKLLTDTASTETRLQFKLNKDANPTWEVMGYYLDEKKLDFGENIASKGTKVTFKASMGLDETNFYPSALKLYLFGPYDAIDSTLQQQMYEDAAAWYKKRIEEAEKVYTGKDTDLLAAEAKARLLYDGETEGKDEASTSEFTKSIDLPTITADKRYLFAASGADMDGLDFVPSTGCYGFLGVASGTPPTISITEPSKSGSSPVDLNGPLVIKGTADGRGSDITEIKYTVSVYNESDGNSDVGKITGVVDADYSSDKTSWSIDIKTGNGWDTCKPVDGKMYKYSAVVEVSNSAGLSGQDNVDLRVDAVKPVPRISGVAPVAGTTTEEISDKVRTVNVVNGTVTVTLAVSDANLLESELLYRSGGGEWASVEKFGANDTYNTVEINTTEDKYKDKAELELKFVAKDSAGNEAESDVWPLFVDQETDRPSVESETQISKDVGADDIAPNKNLFGVTANNVFKATVSDDDGIGSLDLVVKRLSDEVEKGSHSFTDAIGKTSYSLSYTLPQEEGKYIVEITVKDNAGETKYSTNSYEYNIGIDSANPTLEFITTNYANIACESHTIKGRAKDSSGIKSIKRYKTADNTDSSATEGDAEAVWKKDGSSDSNEITVKNVDNTSGYTSVEWEDPVGEEAFTGNGRRRYVVEDIYGNTTKLDFVYYVDSTPPEIKVDANSFKDGSFINGKNIFEIKGNAFDKDNENKYTDVESVRYKIVSVDNLIEETANGCYEGAKDWENTANRTKKDDGTYSWTASINLSEKPDGTYTIYFAAFDEAGNQSKASDGTKCTFTNDTKSPEIDSVEYKLSDAAAKFESEKKVAYNGSVTVRFKITESNLDAVTVNGSPINVGSDGTYTYEVTDAGTHTLKIEAKDKAGNASSLTISDIVVDTNAPELLLDKTAAFTKLMDSSDKWTNSNEPTIQILVRDEGDSGIQEVMYYLDGNGGESMEPGGKRNKDGGTTAPLDYTLYTASLGKLPDGEYTIRIEAKDYAENTARLPDSTGRENFEYNIDTTAPSLDVNAPDKLITNESVMFEGSVVDPNAHSGLKSLTVSIKGTKDDGTSIEEDKTIATADGSWSYEIAKAGRYANAKLTVAFTAEDNAGNKYSPEQYEVIIDTEDPLVGSIISNSGWTNVNTQTVKVTASANDLSGIANINATYTDADGNERTVDFSMGGIVNSEGTSDSKGTYRAWTGIFDSLSDGEPTCNIKVEDAAGNARTAPVSFKIDTTPPEIKNDENDGGLPVITASPASIGADTKNVTLTLNAKDNESGLESCSVKIGAKEISGITVNIERKDSDGYQQISIGGMDKNNFSDGSNTVTVYVKDAAGNESSGSIIINSDRTPPTIKFNSISTVLNKTAVISGTIVDTGSVYIGESDAGSGREPPVLLVSTDKNNWTKYEVNLPEGAGGTSVSWTKEVDTTTFYSGNNPKGTLYMRMTAYDEAGNKADAEIEAQVDQNEDRPVIKFTAMDDFTGKYSTSTGSIIGTISDDDKADGDIVKGFWWIDGDTLESSTVPQINDDGTFDHGGWNKISVDDIGGWEINLSSEDPDKQGQKTLHFYVIDNKGGAFCNTKETDNNGNTNALECPYFQYAKAADNTRENYKDGIKLNVDTEAPEIESIAVAFGEKPGTGTQAIFPAVESESWKTAPGSVFRGKDGFLLVKVTVNENVAMHSEANEAVVLSVGGNKLDGAKSVSSPDSTSTYIYYFAYDLIENAGLTEDSNITISATAKDASGLTGMDQLQIKLDVSAPSVAILTPTVSIKDAVMGKTTVQGLVNDKNYTSSVKTVKWGVPKGGEVEEWIEFNAKTPDDKYPVSTFTTTTCLINFTSATDTTGILYYVQDGSRYDVTPISSLNKDEGDPFYDHEDNKGISPGDYDGFFKVPIWFSVEDSVGNSATITDQFIVVDRDGGKPRVVITTPENTVDENELPRVNGTFTVYGTATDDVSVKEVHVQIDADGDGKFTKTDYELLMNALDAYELKTLLHSGSNDATDEDGNLIDGWYILADGTSSWKVSVPTGVLEEIQKEQNGESQTIYLSVRAQAFDYDGYYRKWSDPRKAIIDSEAPQIRNLKVVQYDNSPTDTGAKCIVERTYESGMYISSATISDDSTVGYWYLECELADNEGINKKSISLDRLTSATSSGIEVGDRILSDEETFADDLKGYVLYIPLISKDVEKSGQIYYKITATDSGTGTASEVISIYVDNDAPTLYTDENSPVSGIIEEHSLRLRPNGDTQAALGTESVITNSNNAFSLGDIVTELESGLRAVAFWFERKDADGNSRAYCPMYKSDKTVNNRTNNVSLNTEKLPVIKLKDTGRTSSKQFSNSSIQDSWTTSNIRVGGLVKIAGTYCTIVSISGNTVELDQEISTSFTEAEFILAQVVDNQTTEVQMVNEIRNDDGDGMVESIKLTGGNYTWDATFDSNNIPDGPIIVHITAMDKAGNITTGSVSTQVANNRPRIAKVLIGTDLNNDGAITFDNKSGLSLQSAGITKEDELPAGNGAAFGEFSYYSVLSSDGKGKDIANINMENKPFKVRDGLVVIPEFVGGNGDALHYTLARYNDKSLPDSPKTGSAIALTKRGEDSLQIKDGSNGGMLRNANDGNILKEIGEFGGIVLKNDAEVLKEQNECTLSFTFWDETEETTVGETSQWALLNIPLNISTSDESKPAARIKPFHWVDRSDNSIHKTGSLAANNLELHGHIELVDGENLPLAKPEISGKVVFTGTVFDDWLLGAISVSFGDGITNETIATYANGVWTSGNASTLESLGISEVEVSDASLSQDGHCAVWSIVLDTETALASKSGRPVGKDIEFSVSAKDAKGGNGGNVSAPDNTQTADEGTLAIDGVSDTGWTALYTVDVIPYVTALTTPLSQFYKSAPSVYSRTALGRYPLAVGSSFSISGWNLGDNPSVSLGSTNLDPAPGARSFSIPETAASGSLSVSVNGIYASNNRNCNDAGLPSLDASPALGYNRQPNNVNNDTLNDDILIDVWEFKAAAKPVNEGAHHVTMKVRPTDGSLGFSYGHDIVYFSMPGYETNGANDGWTDNAAGVEAGKYYSHIPMGMNYGGFTYNTFCYDSYGYSYGSAICTDTQMADKSAFFQFFSRETPELVKNMDQNMNYHNSANASRLDQTTVQIAQSGAYVTNIDRIQSISMEATIKGGGEPTNANPTYVYIAYYDKSARQVRFRWGTVGANGDNIDGKNSASKVFGTIPENAYGLNDVVTVSNAGSYYEGELTGVAGFGKYDGSNRQSADDSYIMFSQKHGGIPVQIIAADNVNGGKSIYQASESAVGAGYGTGEYVSLSIVGKDTANPVAVVTWYDAKNRQLCMAYNVNPTGSKIWTARVIDPDGGINVKTAVDKDGGIHFAYYDNMGGSDLKYAYMSSYNSTDVQRVTVDSYGAVGAKPTIDVVKENGRWIPYIGYQSNAYLGTPAAAKMAYYVGNGSEISAGAAGDKYTGAWETTVVPTESLPDDDLINIGLYRDADGIIQAFPKGAEKTYGGASLGSAITNAATARIDCGVPALIYGNGTSNPVVAYATKDGPIEMAQKR